MVGRNGWKSMSNVCSEADGLCRSDIAGLRMHWIEGKRHMVAQYHPTWELAVFFARFISQKQKRKPYFTRPRMDEPFSSESFNFTKTKPEEVLAKIYVKDGAVYFANRVCTKQSASILHVG